jgi:hypothetical protein
VTITIKNCYPLPLAANIVNQLTGAQHFTKFDVRWGYHNIRIKSGDEWKAAIITNRMEVEPTVMGFGMTNSPATFQSLMNSVFVDLIAIGVVAVYMDDILIYTPTLVEHRKIVHEVFVTCRWHVRLDVSGVGSVANLSKVSVLIADPEPLLA